MNTFRIIALLLTAASMTYGAAAEEEGNVIIRNRILTKINDKTISLLDVVKRMDVYLTRNHLDVLNAPMARYQFYSSHWVEIFNQMIDNELILADAKRVDLKVSDGDVREAMLERFGPNVMKTLEKIGISYDEAKKMVHADLLTERMSWYQVQAKVLQTVGPQDIKEAYEQYCRENPTSQEWTYQILSIRAPDAQKSEETAGLVQELLSTGSHTLQSVAEQLSGKGDEVEISLSGQLIGDSKSLSSSYKEALSTLSIGKSTPPICQSGVYRIFHLIDHKETVPPPLENLAQHLKNTLLDEKLSSETALYLTKLRKRFGYKENPEQLQSQQQPFALY